ncbi:uncharacterized protein LOC143265070 [Megachile rotundata]|uniref:uncharacterized protein LOC143265070 n=1 Tax=Megachile rotundata TaxID=143995 RepID=UPI003FD56DCF
MKLKDAAKRAPCGRKTTMPSFEVITENVLVPVTKTVFTKRCTKRSKKGVKLEKRRSNDNIGPLLKPPSGPVKTADKLLRIGQSDVRWNHEKRKKSKETLRKTGKSPKLPDRERVRQTMSPKERQKVVLPFPCPISALPEAPVTETFPMYDVANAKKKSAKVSGERKPNTRSKKRRNVAIRSLDRDTLKSRNWNVPITNIITTPTTSNDIAAGYCLVPYRDSTSSKIDAIGKRALSTSVVGPTEPRTVELSTSANILDTNRTLQLSAQSIGRFGDVDHLAFKLLAGDPTRCYQRSLSETGGSCKIKYSWEVIGRASQTSRTLLESLIEGNFDEPSQPCRVKYSWQIIGIATQTCERDFSAEYSLAPLLSARSPRIRRDATDSTKPSTVLRNGKRYIVLNNQCTQTFAHKANQSNFSEMHATHL